MPIKPENRDRYPRDWPEIRERMLTRAQHRCECAGECGTGDHMQWRDESLCGEPYENRCRAVNGQPHPETGSTVVLTIAHLDHTPENCEPANLKAMCQKCHLAYDAESHQIERIRAQRRALEEAGQGDMFGE